MKDSSAVDKEKHYWLNQLADPPVKSYFPYDTIRSAPSALREENGYTRLEIEVPGDLFLALNRVTNESDKNLFVILLAAMVLLTRKYTGNNDIITAVPIYQQRVEGEFVNTILTIRSRLEETQTFRELLVQVKNTLAQANQHLNYPVERLLYHLGLQISDSRDFPLAGTAVLLENIHYREYLEPMNFDMIFSFLRTRDSLQGNLLYNPRLYKPGTVEKIAGHLILLLKESLEDVNCRIGDILFITGQERQLLEQWNDTGREYPMGETIPGLFARQVEQYPDKIAVKGPGCGDIDLLFALTYRELDQRSHQLARLLRVKGTAPGVIIGLMTGPCLEMIIGILAVLKAGGTYLPLEPQTPGKRLEYMLNDSSAHLLLTSTALPPGNRDSLSFFAGEIIGIGDLRNDGGETSHLEITCAPGDIVYAIYTSGTTGKPKGVLVKHENLLNYVNWFSRQARLTPEDKAILTSSFIFDLGYTAIYPALLAGRELHIAVRELYLEAGGFLDYVQTHKITYLKMTPSLFTVIVNSPDFKAEKFRDIGLLVLGGEAINLTDIQKVHSLCSHLRVMNHYGPTEATIGSVAQLIDFSRFDNYLDQPTIGGPIDNTCVFILDRENLQPLPPGVAGELCLGGASLASGYLNNPELTDERFFFISYKSYMSYNTYISKKIYKTGDLARWLDNGEIQFLGRIDHQVKIRGYRIELGEIEKHLTGFQGVCEAAVVVHEQDNHNRQLAAYIVPDPGNAAPVSRLLALEQESQWFELPNGKAIFYLNKNEIQHMYHEIIQEQSYIKHGIHLERGACIFDLGANIGLFSLLVHWLYPDTTIYAFEPIPPVYETLKLNSLLYGIKGKVFPLGIAAAEGETRFTYYPNISILSGCYADIHDESQAVRNYIYTQQVSRESEEPLSGDQVEELLAERLSAEMVSCTVKSLSQVIAENSVERIDLLKIVVEKSELDVLAGIKAGDWPRIRQVVIEVHNTDGRLSKIQEILRHQGFHISVEKESTLTESDFYLVYATREEPAGVEEAAGTQPKPQHYWASPGRLVSDLKEYLKQGLPDYMVPDYIVPLQKLPLTSNGKLDYRELPKPETVSNRSYTAPGNEIQEKLLGIWSEVLKKEGVAGIGIDDNFFELGGNSLSAVTMVSKIHKALNIKIPLAEIFKTPTIEGLSTAIAELLKYEPEDTFSSIEPVEKKEYYPLSSAQKRMYTLQQLDAGGTAYNITQVSPLPEGLDPEKLAATCKKLIKRHESLRTSFHMVDRQVVQKIHHEVEFEVEFYDYDSGRQGERETGNLVKDSGRQENREIGNEEDILNTASQPSELSPRTPLSLSPSLPELLKAFIRPFDLSRAPLLRIGVLKTGAADHLLLTDRHHIISDGISLGLLVQDFMSLYNDETLPPLRIQYKDFSEWQNSERQKENTKKQEAYWIRLFENPVVPLKLPTDFPRPPVQSFAGSFIRFQVPPQHREGLKIIAAQEEASLYMVLLALYSILLTKLCGQEDIVIGTPIAGRRHADLEMVIGMFVNTLAIRNYPDKEKSFKEFLHEIKKTILTAFENQDYQFEDLVERVSVNRDASRNPIFDVVFSFFEFKTEPGEKPSQQNTRAQPENDTYGNLIQTSKFDLTFNGTETNDALALSFEYCTKLFKKETIERFISYFKEIVAVVIANPAVKIQEISMVSDEEKNRLLKTLKKNEDDGLIDQTVKKGEPADSSAAEFDF